MNRAPSRHTLALHTWTLDTTPLEAALAAARQAGWDAVELRRVDFLRAREAGRTDADVIAAVQASGLAVACVGVELGWLFAPPDEYLRLLGAIEDSCRWARALGCTRLMSAADRGPGDARQGSARMREVGALVAGHGLVLAFEFNSQAAQVNALAPTRDMVSRAGHPGCRLLLDTYHMHRSGTTLAEIEDLAPEEIAYVQFSDVPPDAAPGDALNRLPPGRGCVPFREVFGAMFARGYDGPLSYEAPNPAAWARPAAEVAREALAATRATLGSLAA